MEHTAPEGLRQRKKEQTRQTIERVILELILERGFEDVTVEDVCAHCDISKKTFFNYYASKEAAVLGRRDAAPNAECVLAAMERSLEAAEAAGAPWSYLDAIVEQMQTMFNMGEGREGIVQLRKEVFSKHPQLLFGTQRGGALVQKAVSGAVSTFLERHPDQRRLRERSLSEETVVAASVVMNIMRTRAILSVHGDHVMTVEETRQLVVDFMTCEG